MAVLGPTGLVRSSAAWGDAPAACPAWDDRGDRFLLLDDVGDPGARSFHLVEPGRGLEQLDLPFESVGCGDFVAGDRLVVAESAGEPDEDGAVWTVGIDGSDPERVYTAEGCNPQVGGVDPAGERVAIAQTCADVVSSGVLVIDLASGDATRVVSGHAALPTWSPFGRWLVFGLIPLGQREPVGVWIAREDGTGLRQAVEGPVSFPGWLPG